MLRRLEAHVMAAERLHADDTTVPVLDLRAGRQPGPIREAACWSHGRRPFFAMADIEENARRKAAGKKEIPLSPIAVEVVRRIDALFEIERSINGRSAEERVQVADAEPSLGR